MRKAGWEMWEDKTLEEWPENDYWLFCGNLGNEVNDDVLASSFRKAFPNGFLMAWVVRNKVTGKSKGFGFVSFSNQDDYVRAYKTMQGKYVGNWPVLLKAGKWKEKSMSGGKYSQTEARFKKHARK